MALPSHGNDGVFERWNPSHCHEIMRKYEIHEKGGALERFLQKFSIIVMKSMVSCLAFMVTREYWNDGIHHCTEIYGSHGNNGVLEGWNPSLH
jgi:hypothetical protein